MGRQPTPKHNRGYLRCHNPEEQEDLLQFGLLISYRRKQDISVLLQQKLKTNLNNINFRLDLN